MADEPIEATAIQVWRFADAPAALRDLSGHGGDEDWLALIPPRYAQTYFSWMQSGTGFGGNEVSEHILLDGSIVRIGAHA